MRLFRRRLSWLLAGWLVFQLVGIVAPVGLAATGVVEEQVCTCPGAEHAATCPMHHGKEVATKNQANPCALKNAAPPTAFALLGLAGGAGVLPELLAFDIVDQTFTHVSIPVGNPASRTELPDSPPPRA